MTPVLNLATQAPYFYSNYDFTGFATHAERQFATQDDGLYELVGDTDADIPISAHITTALLDFGEPHLKTLTAAYAGYRAADSLTLTVSVPQDSGTLTADYALDVTSPVAVMQRFKLGKGVRSRYWQFQITGSADFELETLDILPVVLQRRVSP